VNIPVLSHLRRRVAAWLALRGALVLLAAVATAALAFLLGDAALDFSDGARVATPWMLGVIALVVLILAVTPFRRLGDIRVARLFERHEPALGDRLTNAVQLGQRSTDEAVGEFLRREAVELGRRTAAGVKVWPVVRRGVAIAAGGAGVAVIAWVLFVTQGGDVLQTVLPRFLDPRGDHPPFSRLRIEVTPKQGEVLYGGQFEIKASASGRLVDKLWLVARSGGNASPSRTIMFLAPDKSFFQTLANLREPTEYFVTDGQARSKRFPIRIRFTPQITMVELTAEFPSYTGKPTKTGKLAEEPQALPADTRLSFRLASNRPLKDGRLSLTPVLGGKPVAVTLKSEATNNIVFGSFTLTAPTLFTLSVRDVDGLECAEPKRGQFNILPDQRPRIAVLEPGRDAVATPNIKIPVKVQAEDDFGVTRVVWLRGHNRSIQRPFGMKLALQGGPQKVESSGAFDMGQLGVRPGDVIEYFFEAADNDPRGPNIAFTKPYRLEIISEEQYKQVLMRMAAKKALFEPYFKLGNWLRRLAERARAAERKAANAQTDAEGEAAQKEAQELAKEIEEYEKALAKLMNSPAMFDVEQEFRDTLSQQQSQIGDVKKKAASAARKPPGVQDFKDLAKQLSEMSKREQEEVGQPAQQLAEVARLLAKSDEFVRIARAQATVAQMLRRFADRQDALPRTEQVEIEELKEQEKRITAALKRYAETLPELLAKVPNDVQYAALRDDVEKFLKALAETKAEEDINIVVQSLHEKDNMTGYAFAQLAADKLDKLVGKCQGLPNQGKQCMTARFQPKISKAGSSLGQILAAMGANSGDGDGGQDGYGLFNDDVGLYGPNMELAGEQSGGKRDENGEGSGRGQRIASTPGDPNDPSLAPAGAPGRVRLQPDAKFPLKYRDIVGEYFKSIAETATEEGEKR
jgi:hypothetical protein